MQVFTSLTNPKPLALVCYLLLADIISLPTQCWPVLAYSTSEFQIRTMAMSIDFQTFVDLPRTTQSYEFILKHASHQHISSSIFHNSLFRGNKTAVWIPVLLITGPPEQNKQITSRIFFIFVRCFKLNYHNSTTSEANVYKLRSTVSFCPE